MRTRPRRVVIGRIVRPHGVRGEARIEPMTDVPERFAELARVWLVRAGEELGEFEIERWRPLGNAVALKFRGIDTPEAVARLRGAELLAEPLPPERLPEGVYFDFDLVGLEVRTEEGELLGTVIEVAHYPANEVLIVQHGSDERMIPFIGEVIRHVDLREGVIVVHVIPGMLEL